MVVVVVVVILAICLCKHFNPFFSLSTFLKLGQDQAVWTLVKLVWVPINYRDRTEAPVTQDQELAVLVCMWCSHNHKSVVWNDIFQRLGTMAFWNNTRLAKCRNLVIISMVRKWCAWKPGGRQAFSVNRAGFRPILRNPRALPTIFTACVQFVTGEEPVSICGPSISSYGSSLVGVILTII